MNAAVDRFKVSEVEAVLQSLLAMASQVENSVRRALYALREAKPKQASQVFLRESRINQMEVEISDQVIQLLAERPAGESDLRLLIATLRVTTDLERLGDLALNIAGHVVSAAEGAVDVPRDLKQLAEAAEGMVCDSLRALQSRKVELAERVLESDDRVDGYAESLIRLLTWEMERDPKGVGPRVQLLLSTRTLERMADHATNIAEDVIFWLRGLDVRHRLQRLQL